MITAHLPAAYLGACALDRWGVGSTTPRFRAWLLGAFVVGNLFSDIDLLYFHTLDHRRHLHHVYWTHLPMFWLAVLGVGGLCAIAPSGRKFARLVLFFVMGTLLHMVLDTPFGGIDWLYPFDGRVSLYYMTVVPDHYGWWLYNFIFHWSFLAEIVIWFAAGVVFLRRQKNTRAPVAQRPLEPAC